MEWVNELYTETNSLWKMYYRNQNGYAIFYSPVVYNPKIMIVGYNPGGDKNSFNEDDQQAPPLEHDYIISNYRLAANMKKIFIAAGLSDELVKTVKLNLFFFRSKEAKDFHNKTLSDFCIKKVKIIIANLNPQIIITEGFKTFERLIKSCGGKYKEDISCEDNRIIKLGEIENMKIIGLKHPSGARGLSQKVFEEMGRNVRKIILD